jgi:hypothetical protein
MMREDKRHPMAGPSQPHRVRPQKPQEPMPYCNRCGRHVVHGDRTLCDQCIGD